MLPLDGTDRPTPYAEPDVRPRRHDDVVLGAVQRGDGWRRLARALVDKTRQSAGKLPVWLRVDALDGFFQFTHWRTLPWDQRVQRLAGALEPTLGAAPHVQGVILTAGPAISLGAVDPAVENTDIRLKGGLGLRRLIAAHLVRETVIVPLTGADIHLAARWYDAYDREASWLDEDLNAAELPPLAAMWGCCDSNR